MFLSLSTCGELAGYGMLVAIENEHARSAACLVAFSIYPSIVVFQGFFLRGEYGPGGEQRGAPVRQPFRPQPRKIL